MSIVHIGPFWGVVWGGLRFLLSEVKRRRRKGRRWVVVLWKEGEKILGMAADLGVNEKTVDRGLKTCGVQARIIPIELRRWKL